MTSHLLRSTRRTSKLANLREAIYTGFMVAIGLKQRVLELPAEDRQEPAALPAWQRQIVQARLVELEANPQAGSSWGVVEARIWPEGA